jgi:hypothetical protein
MRVPMVVELRQYTLLPGRREALIDLFETHFVEAQEASGMTIIGTFRDLDDDSRFVWLRGFTDMSARASSLAAFYHGPVWQRHRDAANATMLDSDNVLLLRPVRAESGFAFDREPPPAASETGLVEATILTLPNPAREQELAYFDGEIAPRLAGGTLLAGLVSEYAANNFPALPVREGEHILAWLTGYPSTAAYDLAHSARTELARAAAAMPHLTDPPSVLRLAPTIRSRLRGTTTARRERRDKEER